MKIEYYKYRNDPYYFQITDRPSHTYDILLIEVIEHGLTKEIAEKVYTIDQSEYDILIEYVDKINENEFYILQDEILQKNINYLGKKRKDVKSLFMQDWNEFFKLKKQTLAKFNEIINQNLDLPSFAKEGLYSNLYDQYGLNQKKEYLENLKKDLAGYPSLIDIYTQAQAESTIDYLKEIGVKVL